APYQGQASGIMIRYLLGSPGKQIVVQIYMEGLHWFRGEASPTQFTGDTPSRFQEEIPLADGQCFPGTILVPVLHEHRSTGEQHQGNIRNDRFNPPLHLHWLRMTGIISKCLHSLGKFQVFASSQATLTAMKLPPLMQQPQSHL